MLKLETLDLLKRIADTDKGLMGKCARLALASLPEGWSVEFCRPGAHPAGVCHYGRKVLTVPWPVTQRCLVTWLHECAHAHLHSHKASGPSPLHEYEAELWAMTKMRENGIPVPRNRQTRATFKLPKLVKTA